MGDFDQLQADARSARAVLSIADDELYRTQNRLCFAERRLDNAVRAANVDPDVIAVLEAAVEELKAQRDTARYSLGIAQADLHRLLSNSPLLQDPLLGLELLDDHLPLVLFPVRVQYRFMPPGEGRELWVRIYPDDVALQTHEELLTPEEAKAGVDYWRERRCAEQHDDPETICNLTQGAWRALVATFGPGRATWIAQQTSSTSGHAVADSGDVVSPEVTDDALKPESWSRSPRTNVMPDRFVVMLFNGDSLVGTQIGAQIPEPLILGPDPLGEDGLTLQDGDLLPGEDIKWMFDFDRAEEVGMGVRFTAPDPSYDRIVVWGVRLSSDPADSQRLVESLFGSHFYSPDGMSLIPQGMPTNNSESQGSGFSSNERESAADAQSTNWEIDTDELTKCDEQRLAEALGIDFEPLKLISSAGQHDVFDAKTMNRALWQGTLGYYLEQLLGLNLETVDRVRSFFLSHVTGRGPLPAFRVGSMPYGVLLTSDFDAWVPSLLEVDPSDPLFHELLYHVMRAVADEWRKRQEDLHHAGEKDENFAKFLEMLGLQPTSVDLYRRHAFGMEYVWNYCAYRDQDSDFNPVKTRDNLIEAVAALRDVLCTLLPEATDPPIEAVEALRDKLCSDPPKWWPRIFNLYFIQDFFDQICGSPDPFREQAFDPLVDDIRKEQIEIFSESRTLPDRYLFANGGNDNYIGWLLRSDIASLKEHRFQLAADDDGPTVPRPLLYRLLRNALLQTIFDAVMGTAVRQGLLPIEARLEEELVNIGDGDLGSSSAHPDRSVTRWEILEADICALAQCANKATAAFTKAVNHACASKSQGPVAFADFLMTEGGLGLEDAQQLREVRASMARLKDLTIGELERIFVEHLDVCSYRVDAWQTGLVQRRLLGQRFPDGLESPRTQGIYLGAFGWLENVQIGVNENPVTSEDLKDIPLTLFDPRTQGPLYKQPDGGGFIHGPSLNHAVAAAVLRNAYITHRDAPDQTGTPMAVTLSSQRVRTALSFLEGIRNGQSLGALLGYQFERGLHDRNADLDQYIPNFRKAYPTLADKITPGNSGDIERQESRGVFDGYALLEATLLMETPIPYPFGVADLPDESTPAGQAIDAEVSRLAHTLDAIADLNLSEGVFQAIQGNFDRAGATMKALSVGNLPPEPQIVNTPRTGMGVTHRVALHFDAVADTTGLSGRALAEPGLNTWLGSVLPYPGNVRYCVQVNDGEGEWQDLRSLNLQPIDLLYLLGDELNDSTTEIETRIAFENRKTAGDEAKVSIEFKKLSPEPNSVTLFSLLPHLRSLRELVTGCRPLAATEYTLPSETATTTVEPDATAKFANPHRFDLEELKKRLDVSMVAFQSAVNDLGKAASADPTLVNVETLRTLLRTLADFGVPDAFPLSASASTEYAKQLLVAQAERTVKAGQARHHAARQLIDELAQKIAKDPSLTGETQAAVFRQAAAELLGYSFNLLPRFTMGDAAEVQAAVDFRNAPAGESLTRSHHDNLHLVEEWLHGVSPVRERLQTLETIGIFGEAFRNQGLSLAPLQLPYRRSDHWMAVSFPEPPKEPRLGEFVSVVQSLPGVEFVPDQVQCGLLIDEWTEVIPNTRETTGIAIHYNQPNSEPPQTLLIVVTPEVTGEWTGDKLVGALNDTFDRAKQRAVEPEMLHDMPFAQLLSAVLPGVSSNPFATISTDLVSLTSTG